MSAKYKKTCKYSNYVEHFLILVPTVTCWVSFSAFDSLVCVPVVITSFVVGLKICTTAAEIKKYKSFIKKRRSSMIK